MTPFTGSQRDVPENDSFNIGLAPSLKENIDIHNYVIELSIDPTTSLNDYHDIAPLQIQQGVMSHLLQEFLNC